MGVRLELQRGQLETCITPLTQNDQKAAVLGYLFGVSSTNVLRTLARWLPILEAAGRDTMRLPRPSRKRLRQLDDLLRDIPELAVVIDSFEQRVQHPVRRT